jgi:hypothetical protein
MKRIIALIAILLPSAALAAGPTPLGPNNGQFTDWTAATYGTGDAKICYAFTKPKTTTPAVPGRTLAMLTVTQRNGSKDEVSFTPGYAFPAKATVVLEVGKSKMPFYIQDNVAFTDNATQAMIAFGRQSAAATTSTGPNGTQITDLFSLNGFSAAYKEIAKACP